MIKVLDKGYVKLAKVNGTELDIVNAARISYNNESTKLNLLDIRLINFLVRENHTSPFRHVGLSIEFKAPLMVARQHWRHIVGASTLEDGTPYSELSRRYVRGKEEFYYPDEWREKPENSKQGSGAPLKNSDLISDIYRSQIDASVAAYEELINQGVAPEQARLVIPANALYTKYLWSPSLHAALNFIELRSEHDSQKEIQEYSFAVESLIEETFPNVYKAFKTRQ